MPNVAIKYEYAEAALKRLNELGFETKQGSYEEDAMAVSSVLVNYELDKPMPSFQETDILRPMQKVITRCGNTGVVVRVDNGIPTIFLDENYGGMSYFECQEDGKYRDDGGEHSLDLMNFSLIWN
ncbi:hypothetical protein [Thiomicrorhabdus hydrogeniphila]